jgi:hypothetical protein
MWFACVSYILWLGLHLTGHWKWKIWNQGMGASCTAEHESELLAVLNTRFKAEPWKLDINQGFWLSLTLWSGAFDVRVPAG